MILQFLRSLEGVPQLELDETRSADRADDLRKRVSTKAQVCLNRVAKIRVILDVEKVCRETQRLFLGQAKILDQREIPVLLERSAINVTP